MQFNRKDRTFNSIDENYTFLVVSNDKSSIFLWSNYIIDFSWQVDVCGNGCKLLFVRRFELNNCHEAFFSEGEKEAMIDD